MFCIQADNKTCDDLDECELGDACCQHVCSNEQGGYTCMCNSGFQIHRDGCLCNGKLNLYFVELILAILFLYSISWLVVQWSAQWSARWSVLCAVNCLCSCFTVVHVNSVLPKRVSNVHFLNQNLMSWINAWNMWCIFPVVKILSLFYRQRQS